MILSLLAALVLLGVLVTVHEFGHYFVGRRLGFTILEFAVGMGPVLLKKTKNGIQYSLRALPIGGMCRFYGEDDDAADAHCFNSQKAWKRFLVIAAGPIMNLLLAVLLSIVTLAAYGNYVPTVLEVSGADTPAAAAGVEEGDILYAVDGRRVTYYSSTSDAVSMIRAADGACAVLTIERDGRRIDLTAEDLYDEEAGYNVLGVTIGATRKTYGLFESIGESFFYLWSMVRETFTFFGSLFQGQVQSTDVAGAVGSIVYISEAVRYGMETTLRILIVLSMSLVIFNLLPIPALDGGRLLFIAIELVRGRPVDPRKEGMVHFVGLVVLLLLMAFLVFNDIANLVRS